MSEAQYYFVTQTAAPAMPSSGSGISQTYRKPFEVVSITSVCIIFLLLLYIAWLQRSLWRASVARMKNRLSTIPRKAISSSIIVPNPSADRTNALEKGQYCLSTGSTAPITLKEEGVTLSAPNHRHYVPRSYTMRETDCSGSFGREAALDLPCDHTHSRNTRQSQNGRDITDSVPVKDPGHFRQSTSVTLEGSDPLRKITPLKSRSLSALGSPATLHNDPSFVNECLVPFSTPNLASPCTKIPSSPVTSTSRPTSSCAVDADETPLSQAHNSLVHVGATHITSSRGPFVEYREISRWSSTTVSSAEPRSSHSSRNSSQSQVCVEPEDGGGSSVQDENVDHTALDDMHEDIKRLYGAFLAMVDQGLFDEPGIKKCTERFSRFFSQPQGSLKTDPADNFRVSKLVHSRNSPQSSSDEENRSKFNSKFLSMLIEDLTQPLSQSDQGSAIHRPESRGDSARVSRAEDDFSWFAKTFSNTSSRITSSSDQNGFDFGGLGRDTGVLSANKRVNENDYYPTSENYAIVPTIKSEISPVALCGKSDANGPDITVHNSTQWLGVSGSTVDTKPRHNSLEDNGLQTCSSSKMVSRLAPVRKAAQGHNFNSSLEWNLGGAGGCQSDSSTSTTTTNSNRPNGSINNDGTDESQIAVRGSESFPLSLESSLPLTDEYGHSNAHSGAVH